jgi:hypothetical protein
MSAQAPWRTSSVLLALAGLIVAGIGLYFIALRPPLLPEDIRYMQFSAAEQLAIGPRLATWLAQVFRVLGGYALATGLLAVTVAGSAFRARQPVAVIGTSLGGAASIGLMTAVNFAIDSAFKWLLLGVALIWGLSLIAFWIEARTSRLALQISSPHKGNLP